MPLITEGNISEVQFGDLRFELTPENDNSAIGTDIFIDNYGSNDKIVTMCFIYNEERETNINKFTLKFKTDNLYEGSMLIVGGGGGGGWNIGGGGGGGEVIYIDNISFKGYTNYNIVVGNGGSKGTPGYYSADSGYNSGINDMIAKGGGGGGSYLYDNTYNLLKTSEHTYVYAEHNGTGLNGGSGGGSCGLQYNNDYDYDNNKYAYGKVESLNNPISAYDNYYSFANKGGIGNYSEKIDGESIQVRGGGGGGAGNKGQKSKEELLSEYGNGGDGIAIEKIDINTGTIRFCPMLYDKYDNKLACNEKDITDFFTKKITKKLRTELDGNNDYLYWGGGGGAGSFNVKAGDGGRGGGGGGGYYEAITSLQESFKGKIKEKTHVYFNSDIDRTLHDGKFSDVDITKDNENTNIAKGGDGIPHTGGGGGGGGLTSEGGKGGSGIVILMLKTKEKAIEVPQTAYELTDKEELLSKFDYNKKEFGKNLSKLYNYNVKEHKEFYDYIDHIYEDYTLEKNVPHEDIKDPENNVKKDFDILKYNYDRDIYDIKFHQYLKIIFDLKIDDDSFLLYSKIKDVELFAENESIYEYQRLMIIILDVIEDIIILFRNNNNYEELIKNVDTLKIKLLDNNAVRNTYDYKFDLSELDNDINLIKIQITELNNNIYNLQKEEPNSIPNSDTNYNEIEDCLDITTKLDELESKMLEFEASERKLVREIDKLILNKNKLNILLLQKKRERCNILKDDIYYRYHSTKTNKELTFYISHNNNYIIYNNILNTNEKLLKNQHFEHYNVNNISLKTILNYESVRKLIEGEYKEDGSDVNLIIKIYIYCLLKVKKQNFLKNILSLYIYFNYAYILQNFYKESEKFILGNVIREYVNEEELTLCNDNLYDNLRKVNKAIERMKSLFGYSFISSYISDYKINNAIVTSLNCPYVKIELNDYDSNVINNILMSYRNIKNDNMVFDTDMSKYKKDYYKSLKESFLLEINNERYNIHDYEFIKRINKQDNSHYIIIELIIEDRYSKICTDEELKTIENIYILPKDSSHVNEIYDTDVELLDKYNTKIQKQKKDINNINEKHNKYKYYYEKLKYKNNIYYFILFLILTVIIILNIVETGSHVKNIAYLIILASIIILIIYNYFTKVNLSIVEKFTGETENKIFYDYYNLAEITVLTNDKPEDKDYYEIVFNLIESDMYTLKIRKFKNLDRNTDNYVNNLVKKNLSILLNNKLETITKVDINDNDAHYYYITSIGFTCNEPLVGTINNLVLVKNDESIIKKLLSDIENYETIKNIPTNNERQKLCVKLALTKEQEENKTSEEKLKIKSNKKTLIYTIRNDLLRYMNNKFIDINKIIESIELEKANKLSNKVHKSLTKEKEHLLHYQKEYESKKIKNLNVNNLYKHEIVSQTAFINFVLIFSFILIILLLFVNMFPSKIIIIMIIGFLLISANIYNYVLNSAYLTRKDADKKYW